MDSGQVIAKVICFFNCHDDEESPSPTATTESTRPTEIMPIPMGITTSTDGILSPDHEVEKEGGDDGFWHHVPLVSAFLRKSATFDTEEWGYVFFILLWFYLISILLNVLYIYCVRPSYYQLNIVMKKPHEKEKTVFGFFSELSEKVNNFFIHLGLILPGYKTRFANRLRFICVVCIFLNLCDLLCLMGSYYWYGAIHLSVLTIIFSLVLPLSISFLFHAFLFDTVPFKVIFGWLGFFVTMVIIMIPTLATFHANWICSLAVALTNLFLFVHLIVILLKPTWFGAKVNPLCDSAAKLVTFYAITAMGAISVIIPTRLLWNSHFSLIFFVAESVGRLLFTIPYVVFFFYSVLTHHEPEHQLFFRRWSPSLTSDEADDGDKEKGKKKKQHIFIVDTDVETRC